MSPNQAIRADKMEDLAIGRFSQALLSGKDKGFGMPACASSVTSSRRAAILQTTDLSQSQVRGQKL
jgi:hypothetical protein